MAAADRASANTRVVKRLLLAVGAGALDPPLGQVGGPADQREQEHNQVERSLCCQFQGCAERDAGRTRPLDVIATIETPRGMLKALDIADAGRRTSALFFGSGDYSAATGQMVTERALAVPRATIVAAAAAAGLQAIDQACGGEAVWRRLH